MSTWMRHSLRAAAVTGFALFLLAAGKAPTSADLASAVLAPSTGSASAIGPERISRIVEKRLNRVMAEPVFATRLAAFSGADDLHARLSLAPDRIAPIDNVATPFAHAPDVGPVMPESATLSGMVEGVKDLPRFQMDDTMRCLATTVYFESKGEPLKGQLAVAQVVLNRVGAFGKDVCAVVTAPKQFSFVRGGALPAPRHGPAWDTARAIALIAATKSWGDVVGDAKYFHATHVAPGWGLERVASIGNHVFYR